MSADDLNTKPTIETILEKLSDFRQSVETRLDKLESDMSSLQTEMSGLRTEMQDGFRRLDRKLELHAKNFSDLYADERELESRVDKLEDKAS
jgi:predicted RNase H-like nuclease (RuvC/YqgF family)